MPVEPAPVGAPPPTVPTSRSRLHHWLPRVAIALVLALALICGGLTWLVPHLLTRTAPSWIKEKTGREFRVGDASFNPFTLRLQASDIALKDGSNKLASLKSIDAKGSWSSLTQLAWTADNITLVQPAVEARIASDGSLDWLRFLDALPKSKEPPHPSDSVPRILLHNVTIDNASLRLTDARPEAQEKRLELAPLSFKLDKLSTLPRDRGDYNLQATLNDQTRVQWKGRVGLNPIESSGDLAIGNLPLARIQAIAGLKLPVALTGTANLRANYSAAIGTDFAAAGIGGGVLEMAEAAAQREQDRAGAKSVRVSPISASWARSKTTGGDTQVLTVLPLSAEVGGVNVQARDQKDALLDIAQISTPQPIRIDLAARRVDVPQIVVAGLRATMERDRAGALKLPFSNLPVETSAPAASTAKPATASVAATATAPAAAKPAPGDDGWQITLGEITADKAALAFRDQSFATPQAASAKLDLTLGGAVRTGEHTAAKLEGKRLALSDIALRDEGGAAPWLTVREARALPFTTELLGARIELPKINIANPQIAMALGKDGLDLARKFTPVAAAAPASPAMQSKATATAPVGTSAVSAGPKISIAGLALSNGRVSVTDNTLPKPLLHVLDTVQITAERIELDGSRPLDAVANATLGSGGNLQIKTRFDQRKQSGEAELAIENVALVAASPYLNRSTRLQLTKGDASVGGRVKFSAATNAAQTLRFEGNAAIRDLELLDESTQAPFAQWAELSSRDIKLASGTQGLDVQLADLLLDQPRGKLIIAENGAVNLAQIGKVDAAGSPATPATPATPAAPAAPKAPAAGNAAPTAAATAAPTPASAPVDNPAGTHVKIDRLQITGGDVEFADLSLRPQFGTRISDLSGLVVGLSTEPSSRAEVSLEGKVDQFGLARVSGNLSPLGASEYTDIKAIFRNLEMKNLTPYSGKFAGRKIESGKLSLDLEYKIQARRLKGENQVVIDNLTLGERVESKDATSLPLDLAIALLRDSRGVIDLGLPVQGSLDDPQFSYGSLIWKTIVNVLTKIATAPFRALGALLGGSGEEFESVIFEPGEARLLPPEREKLAKLAKALEQRPQLTLSIEGRFDRERDREALADNIVKLEVSKRAGMKPPAANEPLIISFTDAKVQAALDELAATAGDDATKLRAQYLPPAGNAITGLLQNAREKLTEKGRTDAADARGKYYPELFKLLRAKQPVPDLAYATLAGFRADAIRNTLTAVNKFDAGRVSVAAPQAVKTGKADQVATTLTLSAK